MTIVHELQDAARDLLEGGQVSCVIGYEIGPRGRTRPVFITEQEETGRLAWNQDCAHNLTTYLRDKLREPDDRVGVVVKACDSKAINVLLAEHKFERRQVYVIGVQCEGIRNTKSNNGELQARCQTCTERTPVVYDRLIGEAVDVPEVVTGRYVAALAELDALTPAERAEFWLSEFDRCIRCYACRQACPMCDCPTCLYERDDSLWVGMGTGINEKRTFHLGRAYHLAGRCVGCDECERVCPMDIPISLLNQKLANEMLAQFGYVAGLEPVPAPIVTILDEQEAGS